MDHYLKAKEIIAELRISEPTFYRMIQRGEIPAGERIGPRSRRWRRSVIDAAIAAMNQPSAA
jgi:excisionase family DNA binding protein